MAFQVKSYKELIALSKEKLDEALAPIRARAAKAKADLELAKTEEKMVALETDVQKLCAEQELNFDKIITKIDEYDLLERRQKQVRTLIDDLFPEDGK